MNKYLLLAGSLFFSIISYAQSQLPNLGPDKYLCPGESITLNAGNFKSYLWSTGDTTSTLVISEPGLYSVTVESADEIISDEVEILEPSDLKERIPNVFTPNGDNRNEIFMPVGEFNGASGYTMQIFNRSGIQIFQSEKASIGWNGKTDLGKNHPEGVYYVVVVFDTACGPQKHSGTVTLLR